MILAEDTRRAAQLFARAGIQTGTILSFFEHNEEDRQREALHALERGAQVALISDAGTPLLADPGYRLVRECRKLGIAVSPVPGPSAAIAALSAAGLPPIPFTFLGFLPRSSSGRRSIFEIYASTPGSLVFFERKDRLKEALELAYEVLAERELVICRELTKVHEEFIMGKLSQAGQLAINLLGEITVIIGPPEESARLSEAEAGALLLGALAEGKKPRAAAREVKKRAPGWNVSELYALIQSLKQT